MGSLEGLSTGAVIDSMRFLPRVAVWSSLSCTGHVT